MLAIGELWRRGDHFSTGPWSTHSHFTAKRDQVTVLGVVLVREPSGTPRSGRFELRRELQDLIFPPEMADELNTDR